MRAPRIRPQLALGSAVLFCGMFLAPALSAQATGAGQSASTQTQESVNQMENTLHYLTDVQRETGVDPRQKAAYKAFFNTSAGQPDQKIKLGTAFFKKYPQSPFTEAVDAGLTSAYFVKQDWQNFYAFADKTLALNPDEVDVLTLVGWVIPHQFDPNDPNAAQRLAAAESDEKHALDMLSKLPKPTGVSDSEFAAMKAQKEQQAHSALGLVYFRRGDYADSVNELQQSTQGAGADETDIFVLGVDLQHLNRHADAAAAFARCSQAAGPLQARCTQSEGEESKLAHGGT